MQDIHSIGGRLIGAGGGDRRLRPHHHHQNHQVLKCPRCDSLNTKFCYYNNYNLSQPRHFCKSCRRYWTKGGVLRNVPVGGGCRKSKRSKPKASADAQRTRKSTSHSSSESSSLTASTTTVTTASNPSAATPEVASASSSTSASALLKFSESRFFNFQQTTNPNSNPNPCFDPTLVDQSPEGSIFPEIGSFTSLMTTTNDPSSLLGFNMVDISGSVLQNQNLNQQWEQEQKMTSSVPEDLKMQGMTGGFLDQTDQMDFSGLQNRGNDGELGALDWGAGGDQELFDLSGTVDQAYWSQPQWTDNDQTCISHNPPAI
ncbi:hypothetical protein NMG60_11023959 [Bertholletia excelsa]